MAKGQVCVFLGTRKGAYVARSDRRRRAWRVEGPYLSGNDVYHVAADPRHPGHVYALANNSFWGPAVYRSTDGGRAWREIATPGLDRRDDRTVKEDGSTAGGPVTNLWHFEPGRPNEPKRLYIGLDPHQLYRSDDLGASWTALRGIAEHPTRAKWGPGAGGACLHSVLLDPKRPGRMYVGISAAGTFRSDDDGESWLPRNRDVLTPFLPDKAPEVGQCAHHITLDTEDPNVVYRQDHGGIYVSDDAMDHWEHVGSTLHDDFGFAVATAPGLPGGAVFAPLDGEARLMAGHQLQLLFFDRTRGKFRRMVPKGRFVGDFGCHREGLATDTLEPAGIYFGTTTGMLAYSPNGGRSWDSIPYQFPTIHSVSTALMPSRGRSRA